MFFNETTTLNICFNLEKNDDKGRDKDLGVFDADIDDGELEELEEEDEEIDEKEGDDDSEEDL